MSSNAIMNTANIVRLQVISKVEAISEELFDVQPPQFNNTIRWNMGHIITVMDSLAFKRITQTTKLPAGFADLFKGGTKPADWTTAPPSKAELIELMKKQLNDLHEAYAGKTDEKLPEPIQIRDFKLETIGDVIGFAVFHEGQHAAVVSDLVKVIQYQNK